MTILPHTETGVLMRNFNKKEIESQTEIQYNKWISCYGLKNSKKILLNLKKRFTNESTRRMQCSN